VEVRCSESAESIPAPPDSIVLTHQLVIEPNSIVQATALPSTLVTGCPVAIGAASPWHVVVRSDQPGFSYAGGVRNGVLPTLPVSMSLRQ
jgi:hypothetical protein